MDSEFPEERFGGTKRHTHMCSAQEPKCHFLWELWEEAEVKAPNTQERPAGPGQPPELCMEHTRLCQWGDGSLFSYMFSTSSWQGWNKHSFAPSLLLFFFFHYLSNQFSFLCSCSRVEKGPSWWETRGSLACTQSLFSPKHWGTAELSSFSHQLHQCNGFYECVISV